MPVLDGGQAALAWCASRGISLSFCCELTGCVCSAWHLAKNKRSASQDALGGEGHTRCPGWERLRAPGAPPGSEMWQARGQSTTTTYLPVFFCFFSPFSVLHVSKDKGNTDLCVVSSDQGSEDHHRDLGQPPLPWSEVERPLRGSTF